MRFTDLAGETGETLTVAYAPEITVDATDVAVTEGEDAVFHVLSQGSPDPDVVWQRRVSGFWHTIAPDDDNFEIDGGTLTVPGTNRDQSGARSAPRRATRWTPSPRARRS